MVWVLVLPCMFQAGGGHRVLDSRDAFHETNLTYDLHTTSPPERLSNLFLCHRMPAAGSLVFGISRKSQAIHRFVLPLGLIWQLWILQR